MPGELVLPTLRPEAAPDEHTGTPFDNGGPWIVILYNCDCHSFDEVIHQLQIATGCGQARAEQIAEEAHHRGRAIAHTGAPAECERAAGILRSIGLQVETDRL
jgi:ATP-dependent Clp protease adapter protein ClpS